jgi:hypothetical protein
MCGLGIAADASSEHNGDGAKNAGKHDHKANCLEELALCVKLHENSKSTNESAGYLYLAHSAIVVGREVDRRQRFEMAIFQER